MGAPLIERQRKNVILTSEGKSLYLQCQKIFATVLHIQDQFADNQSHIQKLSIACSDSLSYGLIGTVFSVFRKMDNQFQLIHQTGSASLFLNDIESGKLDFGIFFNVPTLPENLAKTKIADVDFYFVIKNNLKNRNEILNSYIANYSQSQLSPEELPLFKNIKAIIKMLLFHLYQIA